MNGAMIRTSVAKHRQSRAIHYNAARQNWRHSKPYLELDDATTSLDEIPDPLPAGCKIDGGGGLIERRGVVVVVPSPWISERVNRRAARFFRQHGFELRTACDSPHFTESYVKEWVRFSDKPLRGKVFSPKVWLERVTVKHGELYCGE